MHKSLKFHAEQTIIYLSEPPESIVSAQNNKNNKKNNNKITSKHILSSTKQPLHVALPQPPYNLFSSYE